MSRPRRGILAHLLGSNRYVLGLAIVFAVAIPEALHGFVSSWGSGTDWGRLFELDGPGIETSLIAATAGLGLVSAILSSLSGAMTAVEGREGALAALLCTAANFSLLGIGAPFWGLVFGLLVHFIMTWNRTRFPAKS